MKVLAIVTLLTLAGCGSVVHTGMLEKDTEGNSFERTYHVYTHFPACNGSCLTSNVEKKHYNEATHQLVP